MAGRGPYTHKSLRGAPGPVKGNLSRLGIIFLCLSFFILLRLVNPVVVESIRETTFSFLNGIAQDPPSLRSVGTPRKVVIVDIDDTTIAKFGRWPLQRDTLAELVDAIAGAEPATVGFAYVFSTPFSNSGDGADRKLAKSLRGRGVALGTAEARSTLAPYARNLPFPTIRVDQQDAMDALPVFSRLMPVPELFSNAVSGVGVLSLQLSHGGVPRRLPAAVRYGDGIVLSLPLEMMRIDSEDSNVRISGNAYGVGYVVVGGRRIPTDANGVIWFSLDRKNSIQRFSAAEILSGKANLIPLKGSYVLIGSTAAGVSSEYISADGGLVPGLDALASSLSGLLRGQTYYYPVDSLVFEIFFAFALAVGAFLTDRFFNVKIFLVFGAGFFLMLWGIAFLMIARTGQILDSGLLSVFAVGMYASLMLNKHRLARQEARTTILQKEDEVLGLREENARVSVVAANPRLSVTLSHELRQPLTAARNYLGAIRRLAGNKTEGNADKLANYADEASRQISSMSELMNELADVIRGDLTLQTESHLEELVSETVTSTVSSFEGEDVQVTHYVTFALPPVLLNRKQIQQVISNLVRNAIEAPRPRKQLNLAITMRVPNANFIEISIADDANGILDYEQHRIFSRFVSSKKGGSGIGLALCRDIVEAHGGRIWFESTPGLGTTFFFTLRRAD